MFRQAAFLRIPYLYYITFFVMVNMATLMRYVLHTNSYLIIHSVLHNAFNNLLYKIRCDILAVCHKSSSKE